MRDRRKYRGMPLRPLGLVALLVLACAPVARGQVSVNARLEQPTIPVGQTTVLSVDVTVSSGVAPTPRIPNVDHLAVSPRGGQSIRQTVVNGRFQLTQTFSYYVISDRPGVYAITPITVEHQGKTYSANALSVTVLERGRPVDAEEAPEAFLKASVDRETLYVNEPVVLTYQQYSRYEPTGQINLELNPNVFKGFWHEDVPQERLSYRPEQIGSVQYYVVDLKQVVLFPIASGEVTIEPVRLRTVLKKPRERRSRSLFNDFFSDDFFGRSQGAELELLANPVTLNVLPLPQEGRPEEFSGAVGQYHLTANVNTQELKAGDPLTLTVTVQGRGNLKNLPEPALPNLEAFDRYDSPKKESLAVQEGTLSGRVDFEYLLVPRTAEANLIGPIQLSYFNTALKRYMTEKTEPITLKVLASERADEETIVLGSGPRQREIRILGEDLRYIHTGPEALALERSPGLGLPLVVSVHVLPAGLLLACFLYIRRQKRKAADPAWARRQGAPRQARRNLRECERLLEAGQSEPFYAAVQRTLLHYFGQRLGISLVGLTLEDRQELLLQQLKDASSAERIEALLATCDEARFAPGAAEPARMREILELLREVLRQG